MSSLLVGAVPRAHARPVRHSPHLNEPDHRGGEQAQQCRAASPSCSGKRAPGAMSRSTAWSPQRCIWYSTLAVDGCLPASASSASAASASVASAASAASASVASAASAAAASAASAASAAVVVCAHGARRPRCPALAPPGTFGLRLHAPHHHDHRDDNDAEHPDEYQKPESRRAHGAKATPAWARRIRVKTCG